MRKYAGHGGGMSVGVLLILISFLCSSPLAAIAAEAVPRPVRHILVDRREASSDSLKAPDFAFPKEVADSASIELRKAVDERNGRGIVEALVSLGLAQTMIAPDSIIPFIGLVDGFRLKEKDATVRSLLCLLEAKAMRGYYDSNRRELDGRTSQDSCPDDMTLWSGVQIADRISKLAMDALNQRDKLLQQPVEAWRELVVADSIAALFYPSMWDFVCANFSGALSSLPGNGAKLTRGQIAREWAGAYDAPSAAKVSAILNLIDVLAEGSDDAKGMAEMYYEENSAVPYAIEILLKYNAATYSRLKDFEAMYPDYVRINCVRNALARLVAPKVSVGAPGLVALNREFNVETCVSNAGSLCLNIYRLPDDVRYPREVKNVDALGAPVKKVQIGIEGRTPYCDETKNVSVSLNRYGRYVIVPEIDGREQGFRNADVVTCSDLAIIGGTTDGVGYAVDSYTGKPRSNVDIVPQINEKVKWKSAKSDSRGRFKIAPPKSESRFVGGVRVIPQKNGDRFSPGGAISWNYVDSEDEIIICSATLQTSLPVYHPGDTVEFMAVVYSPEFNRHAPIGDRQVNVMMCDANNQFIDTLRLVTDGMGRLNGKFPIPDSGLTGYYSIVIAKVSDDKDIRLNSSTRFMVSDYKLPTFKVTVDSLKESNGEYVFSGSAVTYSGFPVGDANVTLRIGLQQPFYYRYSPGSSDDVREVTLTSGMDGLWRWTLSADSLSRDIASGRNILTVEARVTDAAGETQTDYSVFPLGMEYRVVTSMGGKSYDAGRETRLPVGVRNSLNQYVDATLLLKFMKRDSLVYQVNAVSRDGVAVMDLDSVGSGTYRIEAVLALPDGKKDVGVADEVVIYRIGDKASPSENPLWLPTTTFRVQRGSGPVGVTFATLNDSVNVLATLSTGGELLKQWWVTAKGGMDKILIDVPDSISQLALSLNGVYKCRGFNRTVIVNIDNPDRELKIEIENLRDYVTPQSAETVTLKISNGSGSPVGAAALLDIYSKAIEKIERPNQAWRFLKYGNGWVFSVVASLPYRATDSYAIDPVVLPVKPMLIPSLNMYGESFSRLDNVYVRGGAVMYKANSVSMMSLDGAVAESATDMEEDAETVNEDGLEKAVENDADAATSDATADFRVAETPLALFAPMLETGDGRIEVSFLWPNSNTTWVVKALAYDSDLSAASAVAEVIASKPVMISTNAPRFLRYGDEACISSTVMNNTDSVADVKVSILVIDPLTMKPIGDEVTRQLTIGCRESATEAVTVKVPGNLQYIIMKSSASVGGYSDAEQHIVPLLEASQPVVDAETFYLSPESGSYSSNVTSAGDSTEIVLTFTANPAWEVMTSLPGIRENNPSTSTEAVSNLFSIAVARGLIADNPDVIAALKSWFGSHAENEAMLSKLNRNPQLKQLSLDATPWVLSASDDVERMERIALLFDKETTSRAYGNGVEDLSKFRDEQSGGFRWSVMSSTPSVWATEKVLLRIGRLCRLGYVSEDDFGGHVDGALGYLDREICKRVALQPDYHDLDFAWICSFFPDYRPSEVAEKANQRAIAAIREGWKKCSLEDKAVAAVLLWRCGDRDVPLDILRSLDQFSTYTPETGRCWQLLSSGSSQSPISATSMILNAYSEVSPQAAQVDQIRQWLVMNKISQNWGVSSVASDAVASILSSGSQWLTIPDSLRISVGGAALPISEVDKLTGSVIAKIPNAGGPIAIVREPGVPAWGATLAKSVKPMRQVRSHSTKDLKIEKQMLAYRNGKWIETTDFNVGEALKVRLLITAKRRIDYVTIVDNRPAAFEPSVQTPRTVFSGALGFYLENRDSSTNLFVESLPKGTYILEYDMDVSLPGGFSSGVATIQSQYAPEMTAHSAGTVITVR